MLNPFDTNLTKEFVSHFNNRSNLTRDITTFVVIDDHQDRDYGFKSGIKKENISLASVDTIQGTHAQQLIQ